MSDTTDTTTQATPGQGGAGTLTAADLQDFRRSFESNPSNRLMQNVVTQHDVNDVALDREIVAGATHSFSTLLDDWSVTNQSRTGRCWMFAGLNLFRADSRKLLNLKQFEFSQNYMMFWDKMERPTSFWRRSSRPPTCRWTTAPSLGCWRGPSKTAASGICSLDWCRSTAWCPRAS